MPKKRATLQVSKISSSSCPENVSTAHCNMSSFSRGLELHGSKAKEHCNSNFFCADIFILVNCSAKYTL